MKNSRIGIPGWIAVTISLLALGLVQSPAPSLAETIDFEPASLAALTELRIFTHTGSGSGTLGGTPFPTSDFVITSLADTANRQGGGDVWSIEHTSSSIWIAGLGDLEILTATRTFVCSSNQIVGFSRAYGLGGADLFNGPTDAAFASWDMLTLIGPISGLGSLMSWSGNPLINTSEGVLIFNDASSVGATFSADIPEPATLGLLAVGGVALIRRKRR